MFIEEIVKKICALLRKALLYSLLFVSYTNVFPGCQPRDNMKVGDFLKDFPKQERLSPIGSINLRPFGITLPDGFGKYRDWFIVETSQEDSYVSLVNPAEGRVIKLISKGRGPGELTFFRSWQVLGDTLRIYDPNLKNYYFFDLARSTQEGRPEIIRRIEISKPEGHAGPYHPVQIYHTGGGLVSFGRFETKEWYSVLDDKGEVINSIQLPDFENMEDVPDTQLEQIGSTSFCTIKPDGKALAAAMLDADAVSFSFIEEDGLKEYKRQVFTEPEMSFVAERLGYIKTASYCFMDAGCNDRYVCFLYSGKQILGEIPAHECNDLLIYNWIGEPVKRIILQNTVCKICVDGNTLYGCSTYPEAKIFIYDLSGL